MGNQTSIYPTKEEKTVPKDEISLATERKEKKFEENLLRKWALQRYFYCSDRDGSQNGTISEPCWLQSYRELVPHSSTPEMEEKRRIQEKKLRCTGGLNSTMCQHATLALDRWQRL